MNIDIDPVSDVPLYQQLRDRLVEAIAYGQLKPGDSLASVRQTAANFGINVATVSKGYDMLRQEGLVATHRRSGTVVARGPNSGRASPGFREEWRGRLRTLLAEGFAHGIDAHETIAVTEELLVGLSAAHDTEGNHP